MDKEKDQMLGHEYLARLMHGYGVTHVFHIEAMLRLARREMEQMGIQPIMPHSEGAAGYMADGYARISGKPGICMCQSIGTANMTGGLEDAYLATSPVIALTGKKPPFQEFRNGYQESDHRLFFEAITKFNAEVKDVEQLPYLIRQCFREVTTGKPRPAHLDIPCRNGRKIEMGIVDEPFALDPAFGQYPAIRHTACDDKIKEAANAINASERPVIVVGRGARVSNAGDEVYALAVKGDIPVVTSPDGKTVIDETDPLWSGICGEYGMDCGNKALREADLVIFIGTQAGDQTTNDWSCPPIETKIVQIDIEPSELGRNYPDTVGLLGDAKLVTAQLAEAIQPIKRTSWRKVVAAYLQETFKEYEPNLTSEATPIRPERLCAEISKVLPDDAVLVADTGFAAVWTATMLRMKTTQRYLRAAGSLGWAFPASLGVKCAVPERPVVCFTGDGGFLYHMVEMETAIRYGINTVTVVNNNSVLAQCSGELKKVFKNVANGTRPYYGFESLDYSKIAKEFGCYSIRVTDSNDIGPAIQEALASNKAAVVEVVSEPDAYIPPAIKEKVRFCPYDSCL